MPAFKPPAKFPGLDKLPGPLRGLAEFFYPQDSTQIPAIGMAQFPNKVPPLPVGQALKDEVLDQIKRFSFGRGDSADKLHELMPEFNPGQLIDEAEPSLTPYWTRVSAHPEVMKLHRDNIPGGSPGRRVHDIYKGVAHETQPGPADTSDSALQALMRLFAD